MPPYRQMPKLHFIEQTLY